MKLEKILEELKVHLDQKIEKEGEWVEGEWVKYSGPVLSSAEYLAAINSLLEGWLIFGKKSREFELIFSKYLGKKHGTLTNSGSSANLLMVSSLTSQDTMAKHKLSKGDKIITPVVCFPTTLNPMIQLGFEPEFVDVTLPSLNLDLDQVEQRLKDDAAGRIKGIMFAHVLGNPPDMDRLMGLVDKYNLIFLEDACDALGSKWDNKVLGSFGFMSTCSFFPAHHMTMGEGGFIATNDSRQRKILASFRDWGRACYCNSQKPGDVTAATACGDRFGKWLPGDPNALYDHRYVFDEIGYNLKPLELQACIGLEQLKKLEILHEARRNNFKKLNAIFEKYEKYFHMPKALDKADPSWFGYLLTVKDGAPFSRFRFVTRLENKKIQTRSYFTGNSLNHPAYYHLKGDKEFPIADKITHDSFFLGTYAGLSDEKLAYIEKCVDKFFKDIK